MASKFAVEFCAWKILLWAKLGNKWYFLPQSLGHVVDARGLGNRVVLSVREESGLALCLLWSYLTRLCYSFSTGSLEFLGYAITIAANDHFGFFSSYS